MRKCQVLACGIAVKCSVAISLLTACGSAPSRDGEELGTQSELLAAPGAGSGSVSVSGTPSLADWQRATKSTRPPTAGCFSISYPSQAWTSVQCATPPISGGSQGGSTGVAAPSSDLAVPSSGVESNGGNGGNGNDWFAYVTGSKIQDVAGIFPLTDNLQSEYDPQYNNRPNAYCLQINSNRFYSPACGSYLNCLGWQQFEYSSTQLGGVFMEYWMYNYPPAGSNNCPSGWSTFNSTTCHLVSEVNPVPLQVITSLNSMELFGSAQDPEFDEPLDMVWLYADGTYYAIVENAATLSLYQNWSYAEFNVVGDWNSTEAVFNSGTLITVQSQITPITYPGGNWLTCQHSAPWYTLEYNNLTLGTLCSANQGSSSDPTGYIQFSEHD